MDFAENIIMHPVPAPVASTRRCRRRGFCRKHHHESSPCRRHGLCPKHHHESSPLLQSHQQDAVVVMDFAENIILNPVPARHGLCQKHHEPIGNSSPSTSPGDTPHVPQETPHVPAGYTPRAAGGESRSRGRLCRSPCSQSPPAALRQGIAREAVDHVAVGRGRGKQIFFSIFGIRVRIRFVRIFFKIV
jgi:hypothetical protein